MSKVSPSVKDEVNLGYGDADGAGGVKKLKAKDLLVPVGSRRKEKGPSDKPSFKVPVVHDRNKFTDERGYNALTDPALKHFWKKSVARKMVVRNGLVTEDFRVLDTTKKAYLRRYHETLDREAQPKQEAAQALTTSIGKKLVQEKFAEREEARKKYARIQAEREEARMLLEKKVEMNRTGLADAPPSEQDRLYLEQRKLDAEIFREKEQMKHIELQAEHRMREAKKERQIREETEQRKQAIHERLAADDAQLIKVKSAIEAVKEATEKKREAIKVAAETKRARVRADAAELRELVDKTQREREAQRKAEADERAAKRAAELAAVADRQRKLQEAKDKAAALAADKERAEIARLRREAYEEEQARRKREQEEKDRRRLAKEAFQREREKEARRNREMIAQEKKMREELEAARLAELAAKKDALKKKMAEEKLIRQKTIELAQAKIAEKMAFEAAMDKQIQADIIAANERAFKEEQQRLWDEALLEEKRAEAAKADAAKKAKRDAEKKEAEEAKEKRRLEALARKEASEKAAKELARREALQRAKEESERRIRYMERFG
eukprot:m.235448 g.235448  ORF g.235448 m.235448 type:complete len:557 (+) comp15761_c0_seq3:95-1765(+)